MYASKMQQMKKSCYVCLQDAADEEVMLMYASQDAAGSNAQTGLQDLYVRCLRLHFSSSATHLSAASLPFTSVPFSAPSAAACTKCCYMTGGQELHQCRHNIAAGI